MITAILQIIAAILPWIIEILGEEAEKGRKNAAFDTALAKNDAALVSRLLSERFDTVRGLRAEGRGSTG
jgi:hypothetical protein